MKVGLLVHRFPPFVGGSEHYAERLAHELHARGHEVVVYTTRHPARRRFPFRVRGLRAVSPPGSGYIVWPELLRDQLQREIGACDVLHAVSFSMFSTFVALAIGARFRRPRVLTTYYHPPEANPRPWLNAAYDRTAGRLIAGSYEGFIVHSAAEEAALRRHVAARPRARIERVRSPSTIAGTPPAGGFRAAHGLAGKFLALYVGRIDRHKGAATLLQAAAELKRRGWLPELAVAVVGPVETWYQLPPELERLRAELAGTVQFVGPRFGPALAAAYAESDVAIVPSRYESYGLTIVEALSYGTPVIATRTGVAPELVRPGETGYLFDYGDAAALADHLCRARATAAAMRPTALAAVADLTWARTVDRTEQLYRDLLIRQRGTGAI